MKNTLTVTALISVLVACGGSTHDDRPDSGYDAAGGDATDASPLVDVDLSSFPVDGTTRRSLFRVTEPSSWGRICAHGGGPVRLELMVYDADIVFPVGSSDGVREACVTPSETIGGHESLLPEHRYRVDFVGDELTVTVGDPSVVVSEQGQ